MKVLVISHNSFSTFQSMGKTFCTLFSEFRKDDICQLYTYLNVPDCDKCSSYYRMSDKDVLNWFKKGFVCGRELRKDEINFFKHQLFDNESDARLYKRKNDFVKFARDLMWFIVPWFNKSLKQWLMKERPTHIFLAPGNYCFIYDVALKCSKFLNIPVVTYICDEYYFVDRKMTFWERIHYGMLSKKIEQISKKSLSLVAICDKLKDAYVSRFECSAFTVMTGASQDVAKCVTSFSKVNKISYMGNLNCGRDQSLLEIGFALESINQKYGTHYSLKIYTSEQNSEVLGRLKKCKCIQLMGFVSGEEFFSVLNSSEILLHAESFDPVYADLVKHSVSTKIADSLSSGTLLLAYGPSNLASIEYLRRARAAFCIDSQKSLECKLLALFQMNIEDRNSIVERALNLARENHCKEKNSRKLLTFFEKN